MQLKYSKQALSDQQETEFPNSFPTHSQTHKFWKCGQTRSFMFDNITSMLPMFLNFSLSSAHQVSKCLQDTQ